MATEITAYAAGDGSIHKTRLGAIWHDVEKLIAGPDAGTPMERHMMWELVQRIRGNRDFQRAVMGALEAEIEAQHDQ